MHDLLPYARHQVNEEDIAAVVEVLRSDWLTTGPCVEAFEHAAAAATGAKHAVAVSNGTAALHCMLHALAIGPGDEVIVPTMTFAATANAVVYQGGTPVFADVDPGTLLLDVAAVERRLTRRTRAIIAVDYAGQPCDYRALRELAARHGLPLLADACHALGASVHGQPVGSLALMTAFSFHPVKPITTAEGGMVTTDDGGLAQRMRVFRNHGISSTHQQRAASGAWRYEMTELGYNYRLSDLQCALGTSQLRRLPAWTTRRRAIAERYRTAWSSLERLSPLQLRPGAESAWHLFVVRWRGAGGLSRDEAFRQLRALGLGPNVHYMPVHLHPFYQQRFGTRAGLCPVAEAAFEEILSLPLFAGMSDADVERVIEGVAGLAVDPAMAA